VKNVALNAKSPSLYAIVGIAAAAIIIALIFASGIPLPSNSGSQNPTTIGTLTVAIKDAPVQLSKLEVTIDSIEVQSENNGWTKLPFVGEIPSVQFDLLSLQDISQDLSTTQLPSGDYKNIRLHVNDATATFADCSTADLKVPSDKINVIVHFQIKEGATTKVLLDMTADSVAISNSHNLKPVLKATVTPPTIQTPPETPSTPSTVSPQPSETPSSTVTSTSTRNPIIPHIRV
jgi:hypothetical protein